MQHINFHTSNPVFQVSDYVINNVFLIENSIVSVVGLQKIQVVILVKDFPLESMNNSDEMSFLTAEVCNFLNSKLYHPNFRM